MKNDPNETASSPSSDCSFRNFESEDASAFTAAACIVRKGSGADPSSSPDASRLSIEQAQVASWARAGATRLFADHELEWPVLSDDTSEHKVFLPLLGKRVYKVTRAGFYGQIPILRDGKLDRRVAFPSEYLVRQALQNEVFASDIRLEGVNISDRPSMIIGEPAGQPSFVISQGFIEATDADNPSPSPEQIAEFMAEHDFKSAPGSYFGWTRAADGVAIVDAKPDNFILSVEGVVPIDLQMARIPELIAEGPAEPSLIIIPGI